MVFWAGGEVEGKKGEADEDWVILPLDMTGRLREKEGEKTTTLSNNMKQLVVLVPYDQVSAKDNAGSRSTTSYSIVVAAESRGCATLERWR